MNHQIGAIPHWKLIDTSKETVFWWLSDFLLMFLAFNSVPVDPISIYDKSPTHGPNKTLFENKSTLDLDRKKCASLGCSRASIMCSMCSLSEFENINILSRYMWMNFPL